MYTEVPTNGDIAGMIALLVLLIVSLTMCFVNHHGTNRVDDMASWTRNYQKLQRRR